jgi:hypothetical protein
VKEYIKYFTGLQRSFGICKTDQGEIDQETGKKRVRHEWCSDPVSEKDYEEHIKGNKSIGIQPCTDAGTARFGAIDIDSKNYAEFKVEKYLKIIQEKELPLIPVLSKSGGLHLYVFTTEFVKALEIRKFLEDLLFVFKLPPNTEIFPKQTKLISGDGTKSNGNFINLPYNGEERKALSPDGSKMELETFLNAIQLNLTNVKQFKEIKERIIDSELKGGGEEFSDGPPCLERLTKQQMTFVDGRDRFLYNYMVFAKKKYGTDWKDKIVEAGRNYFSFDKHWTDDHIKSKIKSWEKQEKGFTCSDGLLSDVCMKSICIRRKYGVLSDGKPNYPQLSNLQKINYKPNAEWRVTVQKDDGETVQLNISNTYKLTNQTEFENILFEQAIITPPTIKKEQYKDILRELSQGEGKVEVIEPAEGTSPADILKKHLYDHIFIHANARQNHTFKKGNPLVEEEYAWFVYDKFFASLKNKDWKIDSQRTSVMIKKLFYDEERPAEFGKPKRFPGKDKNGDYWPPVKTLKLPLYIFEKEKEVDEIVDVQDEGEVV